MSVKKASSNLVWLDLETSGLKVETCAILEIATIITDKDLNVLAEGPDLVVHQPERVLEAMDEWCKKQHNISGLSDEVRRSTLSRTGGARDEGLCCHLFSAAGMPTLRKLDLF